MVILEPNEVLVDTASVACGTSIVEILASRRMVSRLLNRVQAKSDLWTPFDAKYDSQADYLPCDGKR